MTDLTIVDDMDKLRLIVEGEAYDCGEYCYDELTDAMFAWGKKDLSLEQKKSKYTKYMCHELNLFLKKRDPQFFKSVVLPFLQLKMEKTFIDHYLLKDFEKVNKYIQFHRIRTLNPME